MKQKYEFRVIKTDDGTETGDFALFFDSPDHYTPMKMINDHVGTEVVRLRGAGIGVNLQIVDFDAWSDYISAHVKETKDGKFVIELPDKKVKRKN